MAATRMLIMLSLLRFALPLVLLLAAGTLLNRPRNAMRRKQ